jgi:RNA polymerase sigma factor for flagellar operon FliA
VTPFIYILLIILGEYGDCIRKSINISSDEFMKWQSQLNVTNVVSLNEFVEAGNEPVMEAEHNSHFIQPEDNISKQELAAKLKEALDNLTEKEKQVILLYYYEDMTLKEISAALEVSESRVSQLHTKALQKMRGTLGEYMGILTK